MLRNCETACSVGVTPDYAALHPGYLLPAEQAQPLLGDAGAETDADESGDQPD